MLKARNAPSNSQCRLNKGAAATASKCRTQSVPSGAPDPKVNDRSTDGDVFITRLPEFTKPVRAQYLTGYYLKGFAPNPQFLGNRLEECATTPPNWGAGGFQNTL